MRSVRRTMQVLGLAAFVGGCGGTGASSVGTASSGTGAAGSGSGASTGTSGSAGGSGSSGPSGGASGGAASGGASGTTGTTGTTGSGSPTTGSSTGTSGATGTSGTSAGTSGATSGTSGGSGTTTGTTGSSTGTSGATGTSAGTSGATSGTSGGSSVVDSGAPPLTANVTLHVVGDSTACIFPPTDPTMRVGWASVLQPFFNTGVTVDDAALSGRSSMSFVVEGHWAAVKPTIKTGDYVFIEFGHNDEKVDEPLLFTDPSATCTGSACFRTYLTMYVNDTRAAGGFPVLLTPIQRAVWSGNTVENTHVTAQGDYPGAVIAVAQATGTPLIDMTARTTVWLEALGPTAAIPMFAVGDTTHLSAMGAPQVAQLAIDGMRALNLPIIARLK